MYIEVWRRIPLGKPRKVSSQLYMYPHQGKIYASWKDRPFSSGINIRVDDELAHLTMEANRQPCPFVGQLPICDSISDGYHYYSTSNGETASTAFKCNTCGYYNQSKLHPKLGSSLVHPPYTYLATPYTVKALSECDWNNRTGNLIAPLNRNGRLIVWPRVSSNTSTKRAQQSFPNAIIIGKEEKCILLREPSPA
jgi:hypothetical protein